MSLSSYLSDEYYAMHLRRITNNHFITIVVLKYALLCNLFHHIYRPRAEHVMLPKRKKHQLNKTQLECEQMISI